MISWLLRGFAPAALIGLAACTPQIIFMKDPRTGQVVQCGPDAERTAARDCADNYRARGWVETPHASISTRPQAGTANAASGENASIAVSPTTGLAVGGAYTTRSRSPARTV